MKLGTLENFSGGRARVGMVEETLEGRANDRCACLTNGDKRNMQDDSGNRRSDADVRYLAQAASRFVVPAGVSVGGNLQKKDEGKQRQGERKRLRQSSGCSAYSLHPIPFSLF